MINISISNGQFLDTLKFAKLINVSRKLQADIHTVYPIKIIEKHVTKHLFAYLNKYSLLHKSQSGFRKHHSCNTALINLIDRWLCSTGKGDIIDAVFFLFTQIKET